MLGLDMCKDTLVGDQMKRGISGGQRKRVTTGTCACYTLNNNLNPQIRSTF